MSFLHKREPSIRNNPDAVFDAIWEYKQPVGHLMIVGKSKGEGVAKLIAEKKPKVSAQGGPSSDRTDLADCFDDSFSSSSGPMWAIQQFVSPRRVISVLLQYGKISSLSCEQSLPIMYPNALYPAQWTAENVGDERAGYISVEKIDNFADITQEVVDLAGLGKVVKVRLCTCSCKVC